MISDQPLPWRNEIKYLGVVVISAKRFITSLQNCRQKFYGALNGIFAKVGLNTSPEVLCSLVQSFCLPVLLYGAEALNYSKKLLNGLEKSYSHAFAKILEKIDKDIILNCQYFMGSLPVKLIIGQRKLNYLSKLRSSQVPLFYLLCRHENVLLGESAKYNFPASEIIYTNCWNRKICGAISHSCCLEAVRFNVLFVLVSFIIYYFFCVLVYCR